MRTNLPIRVLCADDHPLVRDGVSFALLNEVGIELVAEAADGREAVDAFRVHKPDVSLIDLRMPILNGIETLIEIRNVDPHARCIVLTTYEGDALASRALKAGAVGYLIKTMLRKRLIDAIRAVHAGLRYVPPEIAIGIAENVQVEELSEREITVLQSVAAGFSNKIIANHLSISENTVKGHMKNIVAKLNASDRTHAVMLATKRGFLQS